MIRSLNDDLVRFEIFDTMENTIKKKQTMLFHLNITFENIEVKGITINLKNFLFLNERISNIIEGLCQYDSYVNFAETLLNGMQIEGEIQTVFDYKKFIISLKKFQLIHKSSWKGYFTYKDTKDYFIFRAPAFKKEWL